MSGRSSRNRSNSGFTIVELLIVIVIIGILAAITIVSYTGITTRANQASIQAELSNASKKLAIYFAINGSYPTNDLSSNGGCPSAPVADTQNCIKFSSGTSYTYIPGNPATTYSLTATKNSISYKVTESTSPQVASALSCPTGFIVVPGSSTYGTSDFCVMKYEAKADDNGDGIGDTNQTTSYNTWPADTYPISASRKLVSTAAGYPVANISQTTAIIAAQNYTKDCTCCHLITEAEWMTLAKNVLSVPSNWSGGSVGSGYIYSGHNDSAPNNALAADASDTNGYAGETNTGGNQKRALKLTNGETIWDMAGNVNEWTSGQTANGTASQPGVTGNAYSSWIEYPTLNVAGTLAVNITPAGTGFSGAGSWTGATNGIGQLVSNPADTVLHGFIRGGCLYDGSGAGVLSLNLYNVPSNANTAFGFRVSR